jgi:hypothetical protein
MLTRFQILAFFVISSMYIVPLAWLYVALMMAVAEATNSNGTVLGAIMTFVFYGLAPVALVVYLMAAPARRRANRNRDAAQLTRPPDPTRSTDPDTGCHAATDAVAPVRKEP